VSSQNDASGFSRSGSLAGPESTRSRQAKRDVATILVPNETLPRVPQDRYVNLVSKLVPNGERGHA
jgi:hypothetical protein